MKPNFKFNHSEEVLWDALGVEESVMDKLADKLKNIDESFEDGDSISLSGLIEKLMNENPSQEELYILAASHVKDAIIQKQKAMEQLIAKLGPDFEKLIKSQGK